MQTNSDRTQSITLSVQGITCALCIQKIEQALQAFPIIQTARVNFTTSRVTIVWDGSTEHCDQFIQTIRSLGYDISPYNPDLESKQDKATENCLLLSLGIAGFAMGNVMLLSVALWSTDQDTMGVGTRALFHWISALISVPAILYAGQPFFSSAWQVLRHKTTNMDVPISLALILACGMSLFETITHGEHVYFDSAIMLTFFLLVGRVLDFKARAHAKQAASALTEKLHGFATLIEGAKHVRTAIKDIEPGATLLVVAGESIPLDGTVTKGQTSIDTAFLSGEPIPKTALAGDTVYAGCINLDAPIEMKVQASAENSILADVVRLLEQAEQSNAAYVRLADRAAKLYTPVIHLFSLGTFLVWFFVLGALWQDALMIAITVLIITCPCALGLAVPVVNVLASNKLMRRGVFLKSGDALEKLAQINAVIFDKTGTLTKGTPELLLPVNHDHLQIAASLAAHSRHPYSQAISRAYDGDLLLMRDIHEHPGQGISATGTDGYEYRLGQSKFAALKSNKEISEHNNSFIILSCNQTEIGRFQFADMLRQDAPDIIKRFQDTNIPITLLSGDNLRAVKTIAQNLNIYKALGGFSPQDKFQFLSDMKDHHKKPLMIGDGMNDAPALAHAHVSMAPGSAIDLAQKSADIIYTGEALSPVWETYLTACKAQSVIQQNFALAIFYNIFAIPLACAGLITPFLAALAMSGSSLLVIANSFRTK